MYRLVLIMVGILNLLTGLVMFVLPEYFYETVPGVQMVGPFNIHFIRDAGLSFGASGLLLTYAWHRQNYTWSVAGSIWPVFHALFHVQMWIARGLPFDLIAAVNLVGIQLPAWVALIAALTLYRAQEEASQ